MSGNFANFLSILYLAILVLTAVLASVLAWMGLSRVARPGAPAFIARAMTTVVVMVTYLVSSLTIDSPIARFAAELRIPLIPLGTVLTLYFVLEFTGNRIRLSNLSRGLLLVPIVLTPAMLGLLENGFYQNFEQTRFALIFVERSTYGVWSLLMLSYNTLLLFVTGAYLLWVIRREHGEHRVRSAWLLAATILGVLPGAVELLAPSLTPTDLTPLGGWFTMLIYGWLFVHHQLLDVVPFAFDSVLRSMEDGVLVVNPRGLVAQANPAAARLLGRPDDELVGQPVASVLPKLPPDVTTTDFQITDGDEQGQRWLDLRISPAHDIRGHRVGHIYVLRDSTEKHRVQALLTDQAALHGALQKEQELNQIKTQMMIRIAHEFRTPLATIQLFGELLERYLDRMTPEQRSERVSIIRKQIAVITDMLDDIATALRGEFKVLEVSPEEFDLVALCRDRIAQMNGSATARQPMEFITTLDALQVNADREMIDMVLRSLISNSMKYSPVDRPITVELGQDDDSITLVIRDQGIGIPRQEQERVFEAFYRASNIGEIGGLGIGLSLARDAIRAHNGTIRVESTPGLGSTFTVRLPKQAQPRSVGAAVAPAYATR